MCISLKLDDEYLEARREKRNLLVIQFWRNLQTWVVLSILPVATFSVISVINCFTIDALQRWNQNAQDFWHLQMQVPLLFSKPLKQNCDKGKRPRRDRNYSSRGATRSPCAFVLSPRRGVTHIHTMRAQPNPAKRPNQFNRVETRRALALCSIM